MTQQHPHAGAAYRVLRKDESFGVEVTIPDMFPTTVSGFSTEAEAEQWIARHKESVANGTSLKRRPTFRRS